MPKGHRRYTNSLIFALPLLKGEVDVVDLLLIEATRIFYSDLYGLIRKEPRLFVPSVRTGRQEEERKRLTVWIEKNYPGSDGKGTRSVRDLVEELFPGSLISLGPDDALMESAIKAKRIRSPRYFEKYFLYTARTSDVADVEMDEVLQLAEEGELEGLVKVLSEHFRSPRDEAIALKLKVRCDDLEAEGVKTLLAALSRTGHLLSVGENRSNWSPRGHAGDLCHRLIRMNVFDGRRVEWAGSFLQAVVGIGFALEVLGRLQASSKDRFLRASHIFLTEDEEEELGKCLAKRIVKGVNLRWMSESSGLDAIGALQLLERHGHNAEMREKLRVGLVEKPSLAPAILEAFCGLARLYRQSA